MINNKKKLYLKVTSLISWVIFGTETEKGKVGSLFDGLNQAQTAAVIKTEGPALVIAGAGSGKTRVLTFRIAHLLEKGVAPWSILALTFTNKSAREMRSRIERLLGNEEPKQLWMGTFHSMFARILRYEADKLGYPSSFTIYDTDDSRSLIRSIVRELQLDDKVYKASEVLGRISSAKNNLITPQVYYNTEQIRERDKMSRRPMIAEVFKIYASRCKKAGAMDFDDLLLNTNILFRDYPDVLHKYQEKFKYILVDEYQDTNYSQYLIVKRLGERHNNVCVVGDDAQSIYSFRGAKIENILNFKNDYPGFSLFKLEQNYRSTQTIVNAGNSIIARNKDQIRKTIFSKNETGEKVQVVRALTDVEEGFIVSNTILDTSLSDRVEFSDFAILYRTNAQSRIFEEALRKRNIPYRVYGSISFYQRKEIKDLLSYLRLLINPRDDEALKRIINYPARGIGRTTLTKLEEAANLSDLSLWQVLSEIAARPLDMNRGTIAKLTKFYGFISEFQQKVADSDAFELAKQIASSTGILKELYNGNTPEERSKYENLEELLNGIHDFVESSREEGESPSLERYLQDIALLTDADTGKDEDRNRVSIMTIHSAKGLEFGYVHIAGVEEELFPARMAMDSQHDLEEERRLFYVAITRAKKKVTISYSQTRYRWGELINCMPGRFISEIDSELVNWPENPKFRDDEEHGDVVSFGIRATSGPARMNTLAGRSAHIPGRVLAARKSATHPSDPAFKPSDPLSVQSGMMVEHQRFGRGKIVHIEGEMPNRKATVFFHEMKQEKQLLLKFAKLKIVDGE